MAEEKNFNDVLDDIFLSEEKQHKESYKEGYKAGFVAGNPEGYHLGYHRGAELGRELAQSTMEHTICKLRHHLQTITAYLAPFHPLVNCHMVEFITQNHWERLLPKPLKDMLGCMEFHAAVEMFWKIASDKKNTDNSELGLWISNARAHCITVNNEYCLSAEQLQGRIIQWGGEIKPEIRVKEFMTSKKSYEVQTMSSLVASIYNSSSSTCCVEVGGGRGHLPVALTLGYGVPSLTIDCDERTVTTAAERIKIIQKQWHAIAKRINDGNEERMSESISKNLHRFASAYVTKNTDLSSIVGNKFPEYVNEDVKILLTGLHTCGNLGPDSLRIFACQSSIRGVFNVPCCYHLLTEEVDGNMFDIFQKNYGTDHTTEQGFPMSDHLRGYNLGRNARMLASQSIDRVVSLRQLPSRSLLYRATLQVVIKKHLPNFPLSEGKLKRISQKCDNFKEYFKMADDILKLNLYDTLPDSFWDTMSECMDSEWKKLVLFYLLRLCLAQVVESVILLDRLLFLFEHGLQNVFLVKLFNPVLSPRCHSIVAIR